MPNFEDPAVFRFGPFELNAETLELRKHGVRIRINGQALKVLLYLLNQPGRVASREELRANLWPTGTFVDFDHSLNAAVNRLRVGLCDSAGHSLYIETLPGVGYRFKAPVELARSSPTPSVTTKAPSESRPQLLSGRRRIRSVSRLSYGLVAASALLVLSAVFWTRHVVSGGHSVVLLPLQNLLQDPQQQYLVDGITDQLITELGMHAELHVISRTSAEWYRRNPKPLDQIARELSVEYVVEGAVTRSVNQIHMNVRLVNSNGDRQISSESYDAGVDRVLMLQREVAGDLAQKIVNPSAAAVRKQILLTSNIPANAVEALLKGKYVQAKGTLDATNQSIAYFKEAIEIQPSYAAAYAALGQSYCSLSTNYQAPRDVMPKGRSAAQAALRLDDTSADAHALVGRVAALYDWDWNAADEHLAKAISLNPSSAIAHVNRATFLIARDRVSEALSETRKAHELDPASLQNEVDLELNLFDIDQLDLLGEQARQALRFDPIFPFGHTLLGWTLARKGSLTEGVAHAAQGVKDGGSPVQIVILGLLKAMAGDKGAARGLLERLRKERKEHYVCAHEIAELETALGLKEDALRSLEVAFNDRSDCMPFVHADPLLKPLRSDGRFQSLLKRIERDKERARS